MRMTNYAGRSSTDGEDDLSFDPPPQILSATIEARLTARVSALSAR